MRSLSLRILRMQAGKTLEQVAAEAGISYSAIRALEIGLGKNYAPGLKHRVSDYFGVNFFQLFPEERERLEGIMAERQKRVADHRLLMLHDFVPGLRFKNKSNVAAILKAMTIEELGGIFHSGLTKEEALEHLRRGAKKYNLAEPKVK